MPGVDTRCYCNSELSDKERLRVFPPVLLTNYLFIMPSFYRSSTAHFVHRTLQEDRKTYNLSIAPTLAMMFRVGAGVWADVGAGVGAVVWEVFQWNSLSQTPRWDNPKDDGYRPCPRIFHHHLSECSCQLSNDIIWHRVNEDKSSRLKQILEHDDSHDPKHHEQSPCDK